MACSTCNTGRRLGQKNGSGSGIKGKDLIIPITILGALFLVNKLFAKDKPPPEKPLPDAGGGIPEGWTADPLAKKLYDALKGIPLNMFQSIERDRVLAEYLNLPSDDMFVAVYNRFNTAYGDGDTLKEWIDKEWGIADEITGGLNVRFAGLSLSGKGMNGWLDTPGIDPARQSYNLNPLIWQSQYKQVVNNLNNDLDILSRA